MPGNKYLWIGKDTTGLSFNASNLDGAEHIDQYCWNIPGNWKLWGIQNGQWRWLDTYEYPQPGDHVVVGSDQASYATNLFGGWTHAKSPLLWGGYTGNVALGSWFKTGATGNSWSGTTLTSSIQSFTFREGYSSQRPGAYEFPYLGGGLTGDVLAWVARRDNLPTDVYTAQYSNTGRDPQAGLVLKVSRTVDLKTFKDPLYYNTELTDPSQINASNRMIIDLKFVKSMTQTGSCGANTATVNTSLVYNNHGNMVGVSSASDPDYGHIGYPSYPRTPGLRIDGGCFLEMLIQPYQIAFPSPSIGPAYEQVGDYGVVIKNCFIDNLEFQKKQALYLYGCTLSQMNITQYAWKNLSPGGISYDTQIPVEIVSDFNTQAVWQSLYGSTLSSSSTEPGTITLSEIPVRFYNGYNIVTPPAVVGTIEERSPVVRQQVIIGDRSGAKTISVPKIDVLTPSGAFHYMPWGVEFAGTVTNTLIENNAGIVYSHQDMDETKYVSIGQINLKNYGILDFSKNQRNFDDWRFGGLSGGSVIGGILFTDETSKVVGSYGVRLWNTQIKGKIYDSRSGSPVGWQVGGNVAL